MCPRYASLVYEMRVTPTLKTMADERTARSESRARIATFRVPTGCSLRTSGALSCVPSTLPTWYHPVINDDLKTGRGLKYNYHKSLMRFVWRHWDTLGLNRH